MTDFDARQITVLRHLEQITQKQLSEATGLSQGKLSKLENGFVEFSEDEAVVLAKRTDYPLSFFSDYSPIAPVSDLTYRKTSKTTAGELNAVASEYGRASRAVSILARKIGFRADSSSWIERISPAEGDEVTNESIERTARDTRQALGIPLQGPVPNVTRSMEKSGIVPVRMVSIVKGTETRVSSEGITQPDGNGPYVVGYISDGQVPGDRLRFTKAHELGHLVLHGRRRARTLQQTEHEAHLFAGAFLLPEDDARRIITPGMPLSQYAYVKAGWGVSISALIVRAGALGIIDRDRQRSLFIQMASRGWRKNEPVHVDEEKPLLFAQMIRAAYGTKNGDIESVVAKNELNMPFRYLDYWSGGLDEEGVDFGFRERRIGETVPGTWFGKILL